MWQGLTRHALASSFSSETTTGVAQCRGQSRGALVMQDLARGAAVRETGGDSGSEAEVTGSEARARRSACYMAPWLLSGFLDREREREKK